MSLSVDHPFPLLVLELPKTLVSETEDLGRGTHTSGLASVDFITLDRTDRKHACMWTYIYTNIHTHAYTHIHIYTIYIMQKYTCMHTCVCIYVYITYKCIPNI